MMVRVTGNRYLYSGKYLPELLNYAEQKVHANFRNKQSIQSEEEMEINPPQNINHEFLQLIDKERPYSRRSFNGWERVMHSHGASLKEVMLLRKGKFDRIVDVIVYPTSTE